MPTVSQLRSYLRGPFMTEVHIFQEREYAYFRQRGVRTLEPTSGGLVT